MLLQASGLLNHRGAGGGLDDLAGDGARGDRRDVARVLAVLDAQEAALAEGLGPAVAQLPVPSSKGSMLLSRRAKEAHSKGREGL